MILRKLNDNHYVILADEKTLSINRDWYLSHPDYNKAVQWNMPLNTQHEDKQVWINKILYSTQPLNESTQPNTEFYWNTIGKLSLSECQEIEFGYSVEKMAIDWYKSITNIYGVKFTPNQRSINGYISGFNAHKQLVKDKIFTAEDMKKAIEMARQMKDDSVDDTFDVEDISGCVEVCTYGWRKKHSDEQIIQSLLPPTEWDVEITPEGKIISL